MFHMKPVNISHLLAVHAKQTMSANIKMSAVKEDAMRWFMILSKAAHMMKIAKEELDAKMKYSEQDAEVLRETITSRTGKHVLKTLTVIHN